jgi:hypothetical protein
VPKEPVPFPDELEPVSAPEPEPEPDEELEEIQRVAALLPPPPRPAAKGPLDIPDGKSKVPRPDGCAGAYVYDGAMRETRVRCTSKAVPGQALCAECGPLEIEERARRRRELGLPEPRDLGKGKSQGARSHGSRWTGRDAPSRASYAPQGPRSAPPTETEGIPSYSPRSDDGSGSAGSY